MKNRLVAVGAMALALSACGGGGGGTPSPTSSGMPSPAPSSTATPAPTPPPSPAISNLSTGEIKPTADASFIAATMEVTVTGGYRQTNGIITGGATTNRTASSPTLQFAATYNAGYHLSDAVNSLNVGQPNVLLDSTKPSGGGVVLFGQNDGSSFDYLALYQAVTYTSSTLGSGYTSARYGGSGGWQHTIGSGTTGQTRLDYFAYGPATPIESMPTSGTRRYTIHRSGNYATDTDLWFLSPGSSEFIDVDFANKKVTGTISFTGENFFRSQAGSVGSVGISGTYSGNTFSFSFNNACLGASCGVPGQFRLMFVGPSAEEIGLVFAFSDSANSGVGSGVGFVDPYRF